MSEEREGGAFPALSRLERVDHLGGGSQVGVRVAVLAEVEHDDDLRLGLRAQGGGGVQVRQARAGTRRLAGLRRRAHRRHRRDHPLHEEVEQLDGRRPHLRRVLRRVRKLQERAAGGSARAMTAPCFRLLRMAGGAAPASIGKPHQDWSAGGVQVKARHERHWEDRQGVEAWRRQDLPLPCACIYWITRRATAATIWRTL